LLLPKALRELEFTSIKRNMHPSVSVIIPAYNRAATIARAINSVLVQTSQDFEIIVVDDASTDQTRQVIDSFEDERIRLICHERNLGAAMARNTGMKAAVGKYVAWLDSDDEWLPDKLHAQIAALMCAAPDEKACFSGYELIEEEQIHIRNPRIPNRKGLFLECGLGPGSTLLFERALLDRIGYLDASLRRYEDWDWLLRYSKDFRFLTVAYPLARVYHAHQGLARVIEKSALAFVSKYSDELWEFGRYRNVVISARWMDVATFYAREHNLIKVIQYLMKVLTTYPFHRLEMWAWPINAWFGIKIGSLLLTIKKKISNSV
jgi:glycosyltransferase involved in cell wall biosynthesis